ncbi:MAG: ATP-binding protein [Akkermansiaceae bacterium]|jgi:signal transduction histidine kinase|nr:ATP-binding protein [Akkermansiaceae bacterium]
MKSIRRRLILWLLPGFAMLWLAGGTAVYFLFQASEFARIDNEIEDLERSVRLLTAAETAKEHPGTGYGPRLRRVRLPEFDEPGSGFYYAVFTETGEPLQQSPSLDGRNLPAAKPDGGASNIRLEDGEHVRMKAAPLGDGRRGGGRARAGGKTQSGIAVVAVSLEEVRKSLATLVVGMVITGGIGSAACALLIGLALRDGLKPLRVLGREVARITPQSLSSRCSTDGLPREIEPVVSLLNQLLDRFEEGFHRERRFSADLAHELRTPLAESRSLIEMGLRYPDEMNASQQQEILLASARMERIVNAMLQLARCEATAARDDEVIGLRHLVEASWNPCRVVAEERGIHLHIDLPPDGTVRGSADLWSLLVGNLLANASVYAPEKSSVSVSGNNEILLRIVNPAPDIRQEDLDRMFDRFWRADQVRSGDQHSGLGLPIARACADAMGLSLTASLEASEGLAAPMLSFCIRR